jgi:hypothetical protein
MQYFSQHPAIRYDLFRDARIQFVTDITTRPALLNLTAGLGLIYYDYLVKEGERPDTIAYKYYDDERYDWLVYLANAIHDPYFQWPMDSAAFAAYIRAQYGNASAAMQTIHHYEWIKEARRQTTLSTGDTVIVPEKILTIDYTTYLTLPAAARRAITAYDYEDTRNESRRQIKLLDRVFLEVIEQQMRSIYHHV